MISVDLYKYGHSDKNQILFVQATSLITPHIFEKLGYRIIGQLVVFMI